MKKKRPSPMKPERGEASAGKSIHPADLPADAAESGEVPRAAPGPGVPISEEEFAQLKEVASRPKKTKKGSRKKTRSGPVR